MVRRIIFHIPNKIIQGVSSGSQIRPMQMLKAFRNIGFEVDVIMGHVTDRKKQIKQIKRNINEGIKYDFLYSESSTMPTALTESHHLPVAPFLDFSFFKFCRNKGIKIGLFYRDIHWRFEQYEKTLWNFKKSSALFFYKFDLFFYNRNVDLLYLPSKKMLKYIPFTFLNEIKELPPGFKARLKEINSINNELSFVYVGGLSKLYDLKLFTKVLNESNLQFNLCTRNEEWEKVKKVYEGLNFNLYHLKGEEVEKLYQNSSIGVLYVKPTKYWEFVMAVKLFEYISYYKPIIAVEGTAVGNFVTENNIGWSIPYSELALQELINDLVTYPEKIQEKIKNIEKIIPENTWEARAKQVQNDLS